MDTKHNHLVEDINSVPEELKKNYTELPEPLHNEARELLDGKSDIFINPKHKSELSVWLKNEKKKRRIKAKVARASRKRNRK